MGGVGWGLFRGRLGQRVRLVRCTFPISILLVRCWWVYMFVSCVDDVVLDYFCIVVVVVVVFSLLYSARIANCVVCMVCLYACLVRSVRTRSGLFFHRCFFLLRGCLVCMYIYICMYSILECVVVCKYMRRPCVPMYKFAEYTWFGYGARALCISGHIFPPCGMCCVWFYLSHCMFARRATPPRSTCSLVCVVDLARCEHSRTCASPSKASISEILRNHGACRQTDAVQMVYAMPRHACCRCGVVEISAPREWLGMEGQSRADQTNIKYSFARACARVRDPYFARMKKYVHDARRAIFLRARVFD